MIILGLAGPARSGKDTVADYLVKRYGFIKFAFSDALYDEVQRAYGLENQDLLRQAITKDSPRAELRLDRCDEDGFSVVARRMLVEAHPDTFHPLDEQYLSPRQVLQWWGTEYRRAQNPNYWVEKARDWIKCVQNSGYPEQCAQHFVECGTRFENERQWITDGDGWGSQFQGNIWHIHRDNIVAPGTNHLSATPLPVLEGERELWNNDSLERLYKGIDLLISTSARFVRVEPLVTYGDGCLNEEPIPYG